MLSRRLKALVIDLGIIWLFSLVITIPLGIIRTIISFIPFFGILSRLIPVSLISLVIYGIYEYFCLLTHVPTLGRRKMGLVIEFKEETRLNIFIRVLVKCLSIGTFFLGVLNLLVMIINDDQTISIHDLLVRSKVWRS